MSLITNIAHRIVSFPPVYDLLQRCAGYYQIADLMAPYIRGAAGGTLLDLGAGTGNFRSFAHPTTRYIWFDSDPVKLSGYRNKFDGGWSVLGSGGELCFKDQSIDHALFVSVSHHLDDEQFDAVLARLASILRGKLLFFDGYISPDRWISNMLWRYDRGRHARSREAILAMVRRHFEIEETVELSVYHRYVLAVATPRKPAYAGDSERIASITSA
jgi:ubiquinone/menaquinone biosynthesis C-methylase UbiE